MATSRTFNLTAELNLRGPTNIGPIISNLRNQLSNISANVTVNVAPNAATNVAGLNTRLTALNATLVTTRTNTQAAAAAIQAFATSINNINVGNIPQQITAINNAITALGNNNRMAGQQIRQTRTEMEEFGRQAGLAIRRFAAFSVVGAGVMTFSRSLDQGVKAFIEYDKQLVKLQQVTGQTAVGLKGLTREITELSIGFGVSSSELTEVASTLAQAGLSARDTEKALKALALSSLAPSFDNMNETVEGSIALMRQFDISAGDLEKALSSINEVSAKFAVEASDIVTAIQRTGGVFATASKGVATGTEALNQFIAVFTSVRATTRESAETIATGLRTIFSRVQRGDTIEALKEYGVNLTDLDGKFVGAYRAVELLSQGLSRIDPRELRFSQITEELGGFRQIGKVIPLIQQFAVAQEALRTAGKGQDSLARDAATAQLSLANQIAKVREQFLALFREIGGSNTFQTITRGALSLAGAMIRIADSMKEVLPVLGIMFAFRGASAATQFGSGFLGAVRGNQRRANGGYIQAYAGGGTVDAMLMPGEAVVSPNVAARIGRNKLDKLNHAEKYAGGGGVKFVPGSGSTDSFGPVPLEVGSYVLRKYAVNAMGRERVSGLAKYAKGGPVQIKELAKKEGASTINSGYNDEVQSFDNVSGNIIRKQITGPKDPNSIIDWKKLYANSTKNYRRLKNNNPEGNQYELVKQSTSAAFEEAIARKFGGELTSKTKNPSYPVDILKEGSSPIEVKFTRTPVTTEHLLNKLLRFKILENQTRSLGFTKDPDKDVNLGGLTLYEMGEGQKKEFNEWAGARSAKIGNIKRIKNQIIPSQSFKKYAKGGPVFGSGDFKFPKRISNSYFKELEKKENRIAWDKAVSDYPKDERLMVDAANIQESFQKPLDREAFKQTFKSAISKQDIFHNMANFAKVIGLPKENLETILPQFIDFKADSAKGSFFSSSAKGSRGNDGISLEPHGYSEKKRQDHYGYEAILKEKTKTLAKIRTTPTKEYDDGSFDFDNVAYKKEWEETDSIKSKIFDLNMLHSDANSAAEVSRDRFAKATGRGSISIDTSSRFDKPKNEVLYHELTHQLMNSLKTKNSDVLSIYNRRVESLFGGDNDDLMDAFDALPETGNYKSADIVYGRSYKKGLLNQIINSKARGDSSISDYVIEHGPAVSMKSSAANRARDFAPLNPEMNKLLKMGNISDETLKRTEDVGKEEFITTLMQNLPHLNSGLQGALDSTLSEILGAAGITRQQYAEGGMVQRRLGILDSDVIKNPANEKAVMEAMAAMGMTDKTKYKQALSEMAAKARVSKNLGSYKVLAGVAGTGKSSLATSRGKETTVGTLRSTTRFPILTPEDLKRATDVIDITATASPDKIDSYIKYADKALLLSTSTSEEQSVAKERRGIRDTTGVGLYGRKAGSTRSAPLDSATMEAALAGPLGSKLKVLGLQNLKRKRGDQLVSVEDALMDLYFGSFSPMQKGHEARARMAKDEGPGRLPYVMVGPNESIQRKGLDDPHSARTLAFPQGFRTLLARAALSQEGISVMPKADAGFGIPGIFELPKSSSGQRKFVRPKAGSIAHTQGKDVESSGRMYAASGFGLKNIEDRIGGFSGTAAREAILSGNTEAMQEMLSPAVFDVVNRNLIPLQNRANIAPKILANYGRRLDTALESINAELGQLPQRLTKEKMKDPVFFTQAQRVVELRKKRDRITGNTFAPHKTMEKLAKRYPEYYGLETGLAAKSLLGQMPEENIDEWINEFFPQAEAQSVAITKAESSDLISRYRGASIPENIFSIDPTAWDKRKQINRTITADVVRSVNREGYSELMSPNKVRAFSMLRDWMISGLGESGGTEAAQNNNDRIKSIEDIKKTKKLAIVGIDPLDFSKTEGPMKLGDENVTIFMRGMPGKYKDVIKKLRAGYENITSGAAEEILNLQGGNRKTRNLSEAETMAAGKAGAEGGMLEALLGKLGARGGTVQNRAIDYPFGLGAAAAAFPGIGPNWPTEAKRTLSAKNITDAKEEFVRFFGENNKESETKKIKKMAAGGEVPIMAQKDEYVINRASAKQIGYHNLDKLNKYHSGGRVGTRKFASGGQVSGDPDVILTASNIINQSQLRNISVFSGAVVDLSRSFRVSTAQTTDLVNELGIFGRQSLRFVGSMRNGVGPLQDFIRVVERDLNRAIQSGTITAERRAAVEQRLTALINAEATALQQLAGRRSAIISGYVDAIADRGRQVARAPGIRSVVGAAGAGVGLLSRAGGAVNGQAGYFMGMGVSMLGTQAESFYGSRESSRESASNVARAEQLTGTAGAGLSLAGGLASFSPVLAGLALLTTGIYAGVDAFTDFSGTFENASNDFRDSMNAKGINEQSIMLERAYEALAKDAKNLNLRRDVKDKTEMTLDLMNDADKQKLESRIARANPIGTGRGYYNTFADFTGMEKMSMALDTAKIDKVTKEQITSDEAKQSEATVRKAIETRINQGETLQQIFSNKEDRDRFTQGFASTDESYTRARIRASEKGLTPQEQTFADNQVGIEFNKLINKLFNDPSINATLKSVQMEKAFEEAEKAGRRLANSMERVADTITQSVQATLSSLEQATEERQSLISSLQGEGKVGKIKSSEANVLRNPKAYSEMEFGGALQKALSVSSAIGGDARVASMISGSAIMGRGVTDVTQKAVRLAAGNQKSISLQDAEKAARTSGTDMINRLNIPEEQKVDLLSKLNQSISSASAATNKDSSELVGVEVFDEELRKFGESIGQRGAELGAKLLDFRDQVLNNFIEAINDGTKQLLEANKYRQKVTDIGFKAFFDLRQAKGGATASFEELQAQRNQRIGGMTGGLLDPRAINTNILNLTQEKETKQKQLEDNANDKNKVIQISQDIGLLDTRLKESADALKELAESGDLASVALDEIKRITELQKQTIDYNKNLLTKGPKELKQQFDAMAQLRYTLSGGEIRQTRESSKAFREAGGGPKGFFAAGDVLAQQRAAVQQAFEALKPIVELQLKNQTKAGTNERMYSDEQISRYIKSQEAIMIETQGRSIGFNMTGVGSAIRGGNNDPATAAAQKNYMEAVGIQQLANQELANTADQLYLVSTSAQNLIRSFDELAMRLNRGFTNDANIENPRGIGVGRPVAPRNRSKGGIIYASQGMLVNFEERGTDKIPAMLTEGEYVVNAKSTAEFLPLLEAINRADGGPVPGIRSVKNKKVKAKPAPAIIEVDKRQAQANRINAANKSFYENEFLDKDNAKRYGTTSEQEKKLRRLQNGTLDWSNANRNDYSQLDSREREREFKASLAKGEAEVRQRLSIEQEKRDEKYKEFQPLLDRTANIKPTNEPFDWKEKRKQREADKQAEFKKIEDRKRSDEASFKTDLDQRIKQSEEARRSMVEARGTSGPSMAELSLPKSWYNDATLKWETTSTKNAERKIQEKTKADRELELISLGNDIKYEQRFGVRAREMILAGAQGAAESRVGQLTGNVGSALVGGLQNFIGSTGQLGGYLTGLESLEKSGELMATRGRANVAAATNKVLGNLGESGEAGFLGFLGKVKSNSATKTAEYYENQSAKARKQQIEMARSGGGGDFAESLMVGSDIATNVGVEFAAPMLGTAALSKLPALTKAGRRLQTRAQIKANAEALDPRGSRRRLANPQKSPENFQPSGARGDRGATYIPKTAAEAYGSSEERGKAFLKASKEFEAKHKGDINRILADPDPTPAGKDYVSYYNRAIRSFNQNADEVLGIKKEIPTVNPKTKARIDGELKRYQAGIIAEKEKAIEKAIEKATGLRPPKPGKGKDVNEVKMRAEDYLAGEPFDARTLNSGEPFDGQSIAKEQSITKELKDILTGKNKKQPSKRRTTTPPEKGAAPLVDVVDPLRSGREISDEALAKAEAEFRATVMNPVSTTTPTVPPVKSELGSLWRDAQTTKKHIHNDSAVAIRGKLMERGKISGVTGYKTRIVVKDPTQAEFVKNVLSNDPRLSKRLVQMKTESIGDNQKMIVLYGTRGKAKEAKLISKIINESPIADQLVPGGGSMYGDKQTLGKYVSARFDGDISNPGKVQSQLLKDQMHKFYLDMYKQAKEGKVKIPDDAMLNMQSFSKQGNRSGDMYAFQQSVLDKLPEKLKSNFFKRINVKEYQGNISYKKNGGFVSPSPKYLASGGIVAPSRYSGGGGVRASAAMINNGVSSNRSVNMSEQLDPIYKALGGLLENHAAAFGGQVGNLNGAADKFQQAFGMVSGGIAVNHNLTAQHNHSGHLNTLQQNIEDKTAGLVSNVIGTMRRSSDGGLDQMLGMDSNQIIGKSKYT
jgi:TP901 family phage tail tape measure protein